MQSLFKLRETEKNELFDRLVKLQGSSLEIFAYDYTYWDEMVNFIHSRDATWAYNQISTGLVNYNMNFIWLYDSNDSLIYSFNTIDRPEYKKSPFSGEELKHVFSKEYFSHFFMKMDTCLVEFRVAPIQPSTDVERKTQPQGRLIAGRLWGTTMLKDLTKLTEAEISLVPDKINNSQLSGKKMDGDEIVLTENWMILTGNRLFIYALFDNDVLIETLLGLYNDKYFAIMLFSIISILLLLALLIIWVSRPIKNLSDCLKYRDVKYIERLKNRDNEFGRLANIIIGFFKHKINS